MINKFVIFPKSRFFFIFIFLVILWLIGLRGTVTTLEIFQKDGLLKTSFEGKEIAAIEFSEPDWNILKIDLELDNLPRPHPFKPQVLEVRQYDSSGKIIYRSVGTIHLLPKSFPEFPVEIKLKDALRAKIIISKNNLNYCSIIYRVFRERDVSFELFKNGEKKISNFNHRKFSLPINKSISFILAIIFIPFPALAFLMMISYFTARFFQYPPLKQLEKTSLIKWLTKIIFLMIFIYLLIINILFVEKIPHFPDSVSYLWQARYLAAFSSWQNPVSDFFRLEWTSLSYPLGHPLALMLGVWVKAYWLVSPFLGTVFLYLLFQIIRAFYGQRIAFFTLLIAFFSPFFQMHAVTFMSHNTAAFYLTFFLYVFLKMLQQKKVGKISLFFAGISYVFLANTRPLTAISLIPVFFIFSLYFWWKRKTIIISLILICLGSILTQLFFSALNWFVYYHPILTPYLEATRADILGGTAGHDLRKGITDALSYLLVLRQVILPGLPNLFFSMMILPIFAKNKLPLFLSILSIFSLFLGWSTYGNIWGIHLGPRFWYEMLPFIFILIATSLDLIVNSFNRSLVGYGIVSIILLLIVVKGFNGWIFGRERLWGENMDFLTPSSIRALKGFNFIDARLIKEVKRQNIHYALIFVRDCGNWWCYGSVANENMVDFAGDIVWAKDLKERNSELIRLYSNRKVYFADYNEGSIKPYILK